MRYTRKGLAHPRIFCAVMIVLILGLGSLVGYIAIFDPTPLQTSVYEETTGTYVAAPNSEISSTTSESVEETTGELITEPAETVILDETSKEIVDQPTETIVEQTTAEQTTIEQKVEQTTTTIIETTPAFSNYEIEETESTTKKPPEPKSTEQTQELQETTQKQTKATTVAETTQAPTEADKKEVTVYITDSGEKYHKDGCRSLSKSKHPISLDDAKARGYDPCGICHPPV